VNSRIDEACGELYIYGWFYDIGFGIFNQAGLADFIPLRARSAL
jgi:hypothetical protein